MTWTVLKAPLNHNQPMIDHQKDVQYHVIAGQQKLWLTFISLYT